MADRPTLRNIIKFHQPIFKSANGDVAKIKKSWAKVVAVVVASVLFFFNKDIFKSISALSQWHGFSRWWVIAPVSLLFVYYLLRANYQHFQDEKKKADDALQQEREKTADIDRRLSRAMAGPELTGYFYQIKYLPRTGLIPMDMLQGARCDCDVFIELYITNRVPGECSIREFCLTLNGQELEFDYSVTGFCLKQTENFLNEQTYCIEERETYGDIPNLASLLAGPSIAQGVSKEGWLHFIERAGVSHSAIEGSPSQFVLQVIDAHGVVHPISEALIGGAKRPGVVTFEKYRQRSARGGLK